MVNTDQDTKPVRERVAEHFLLDQSGARTDSEEAAWGIEYILKGIDKPFKWMYGKNDVSDRMKAVFGAKTLATNESSQVRNNPKGAGTVEEQMEAVEDRFAIQDTGKWVDATRDGVGSRVDRDKLTTALCSVLAAASKITPEQAAEGSEFWTGRRAKLEADKAFQATVRNVPGVNEEYAKLVGRITKTVDDLLA